MAEAWTVEVTREPEWDDISRNEAEALYLYPGTLSPTGCGHTLTEAQDQRPWNVKTFVCGACRQSAIADRHYADEHEDAKPNPDGSLPTDGFAVWVEPPDTEE